MAEATRQDIVQAAADAPANRAKGTARQIEVLADGVCIDHD